MIRSRIVLAAAMMFAAVGDSQPVSEAIAQEVKTPYRVGFLAQPASCKPEWIRKIPWNKENIGRLKALGFTVIQVDVAWTRPDDEILNIEDLVELSPAEQKEYPQPVPVRSKAGAENLAARQETIRKRIALAKEAGLRTLLLVGAPYNAHGTYGDNPPNCILDEKTAKRHVSMLEKLAKALPGLDDLQVYTYDVDAWLCSEFGKCPRCRGVPLQRRLVGFVNGLTSTCAGSTREDESGGSHGNFRPARVCVASKRSTRTDWAWSCTATRRSAWPPCPWIAGSGTWARLPNSAGSQ